MTEMKATGAPSALTARDYPRLVDTLIRAGAIYSMAGDRAVYRSIAVRDAEIVAVSEDPHGLDGLVSAGTRVVDDPGLTLLPALDDTHCHLLEAARNTTFVSFERAGSIAKCVELIRQRTEQTPKGGWIQTTNDWNEANLAERRLPTRAELDAAAPEHPVLVRRGGHLGVANSLALMAAGLTEASPDPRGGRLGRDAGGRLNGMVEGGAVYVVVNVVPPLPPEGQVASLAQVCRVFNGLGFAAARDPLVSRDQMLVYQEAWKRGLLTLRCRPMILIPPGGSVADRIAQVEGWGVSSGFGDDWLKLWGLKFVMDGGVEGAALDQPYVGDPSNTGHLNWQPDEMVAVVNAAVRRGWRIGTHAAGDRAVRTLLDVYERVLHDNPGLPPGTLVVEHALLADAEQRARAIRMGVPITVQHPLLYTLGKQMLDRWGPERARQVLPVKAWLEEGATLAAGSDYPAGAYDAMRSIWGLVTRKTQDAGVLGPEFAIDQYTAFQLYTAAGARLSGEGDRRGTLQPRRLADIVAFRADPITRHVDDLLSLRPAFTIVGGRAVHDPEGLLGSGA